MCGIIGYSSKESVNEHYELFYKLINESKIRGLHSFGISYYDQNIITKKYKKISDIILPKKNKIIFHNRYATSGDYKNDLNNQPITINDISLVFNGVIDMRTKQEMQDYYNIKMQTENDGEILLQKFGNDFIGILNFIKNTGSFAGLFLNNNKIIAIRNEHRPLWAIQYKKAIFYASTKNIFERACKDCEPIEIEPYTIYEN